MPIITANLTPKCVWGGGECRMSEKKENRASFLPWFVSPSVSFSPASLTLVITHLHHHHSVFHFTLEQRQRESPEDCEMPCFLSLAPVCDSNGVTHANYCTFEIAACKARNEGENIVIVKEEPCQGKLYYQRYNYSTTSDINIWTLVKNQHR